MPEVLRNLLRRPGRTALTVTGVAIAVLGFTVLGAVAERIHLMVEGAQRLFGGRIVVLAGGDALTGVLLPEQIARLTAVDGVEAAAPRIHLTYAGSRGMPFGPPPMVHGVEPSALVADALHLRAGRHFKADERGVAVVGAALSAEHGWQIGDLIDVRGTLFRIVGILQRTMTFSDQWILVPYEDALSLLLEAAPWLRAAYLAAPPNGGETVPLATALEIAWAAGADPEELGRRLQAAVPEATVLSPGALRQALAGQMAVINLLLTATAAVGLVVGAIAVMNTMVTAVFERRTEIAVKRALGAPTRCIVYEVTAEAAAVGLLGGLAGTGLGAAFAAALNRLGAAQYVEVCAVTGRLVAAAVGLAVVLGAAAGIGPALHAARQDPAAALRDL